MSAPKKAKGRPKAKRPSAPKKAPKKRSAAKQKRDGKAVLKDLKPEHVAEISVEEMLSHLDAQMMEQRRKSGAKMTLLERYERDGNIYKGFLRGLMPETLAHTFELSEVQIERIVAEWRKRAVTARSQSPDQIIEEYVLRFDAVVDELAAHSAREKGTGRTAAIRARLEAMTKKLEFEQSVGILPQNLGQIGIQIDLRSMAENLYRALQKRGLAEPDLLNELADIIDGKIIEGEAEEIPLDHELEEAAA